MIDMTLTTASIVALISIVTSAGVSLWINKFNNKKKLDEQLDNLLKIAIQYPYLESINFANNWKSDISETDEKYLRYDIYCVMLFNYLQRLSKYYKYNKVKIEDHLAIKSWVRQHATYWNNPSNSYENIDSYEKKFTELINSYLK